jgi:hypothetical protein
LLDYVHSSNYPVNSLTGLFPKAPAEADIALLHRYGIDVVYRNSDGSFDRIPAEPRRRAVWRRAEW